ncbi:hypothetical protein LTR17_018347 [Elasticomyces elasticus]|nr:hypothetical protein LTR17_018347 [Elasticomyces elasticus]
MAQQPAYNTQMQIGVNLSNPIFSGVHHGKRAHEDDLQHVVQRALQAGVRKMMFTRSDLQEIGVHPCSAKSFEKYADGFEALMAELRKLTLRSRDSGKATALGEIRLDYDGVQLCDEETRLVYFAKQLDLAMELLHMPLFLHSRAATSEFECLLKKRLDKPPKRGCVHSFTGSLVEMQAMVNMAFDIGINGCSMKTEENLAVVKEVPLERM